jgi:hypothetical protein
MAKRQRPKKQPRRPRPDRPPAPAPPPEEVARGQVVYARWLSERVLRGVDADSETVRNMLYWLAQANLSLAEVVSELLRDRPH